MPETLYSVAQVAELTNIPTETIYAWERRYKAITPTRTDSGRRVYTGTQLTRLKLLKACLAAGSRIGTIARLSDSALAKLLQSSETQPAGPDELVSSAYSLDVEGIETALGIAFMSVGPVGFADEFLLPLMTQVTDEWRDQRQAIAAEHLVTTSAKAIMFSALRLNRTKVSRMTAVFATPEGEAHDIGLLAAAVAAQSCGVRAIFLGAQMPPSMLAEAAVVTRADLIVLSSLVLKPESALSQIGRLRTDLPHQVKILCGGHAFGAIEGELPFGVRYVESVVDFERMLLSGSLF